MKPSAKDIERMDREAMLAELQANDIDPTDTRLVAAYAAGRNKGFTHGREYTLLAKTQYDALDMTAVPFSAPKGKKWNVWYAGGPEKDADYYYWSLGDQ